MKKLLLVLLVFFGVATLFAQEGHDTRYIRNSAGSIEWILSAASAPDTSEIFPLYYYKSWKGLLNDTLGTDNDSCNYVVYLYTSSISMTFDSTYTLAQTVFNAPNEWDGDSVGVAYHGGTTRAKSLFGPTERWGCLIIKTLSTGSQRDSAIVGRMYLNSWSNQPGARTSKIGY